MRAEKLGITLQRFGKYSSSHCVRIAGFGAEKRWRFRSFSASVKHAWSESIFVRRISTELSASAVEGGCEVSRRLGLEGKNRATRPLIETASSTLPRHA